MEAPQKRAKADGLYIAPPLAIGSAKNSAVDDLLVLRERHHGLAPRNLVFTTNAARLYECWEWSGEAARDVGSRFRTPPQDELVDVAGTPVSWRMAASDSLPLGFCYRALWRREGRPAERVWFQFDVICGCVRVMPSGTPVPLREVFLATPEQPRGETHLSLEAMRACVHPLRNTEGLAAFEVEVARLSAPCLRQFETCCDLTTQSFARGDRCPLRSEVRFVTARGDLLSLYPPLLAHAFALGAHTPLRASAGEGLAPSERDEPSALLATYGRGELVACFALFYARQLPGLEALLATGLFLLDILATAQAVADVLGLAFYADYFGALHRSEAHQALLYHG